MSTTTVKKIGTAGAGRDFSTIQAWEDAAPANLTTSIAGGEIWQGECYNDSAFSSATVILTVSGSVVDATGYKRLTAAAGQSFADNANKLTNALRFNTANGVSLTLTADYQAVVRNAENFFQLDRLQLAGRYHNTLDYETTNTSGWLIQNCIVENQNTTDFGRLLTASNFAISAGTPRVINCLFVCRSPNVDRAVSWIYAATGALMENCTVVSTATGQSGIWSSHPALTVKNCAAFGFTTAFGSTGYSASSDYNATDKASATGGAHDLVNLTYASQFQNTTDATRDFRALSTSGLANAGVRDAANTGDLDIVGQSRSITSPTIGAWEVVSGGSVVTINLGLGSFNWSGIRAPAAVELGLGIGTFNWQGIRAPASLQIGLGIGSFNWQGRPLTISSGAGSTVQIFNGVVMADGIYQHETISEPFLTLVPAGGGSYTVTKTHEIRSNKGDADVRETYLVDGKKP